MNLLCSVATCHAPVNGIIAKRKVSEADNDGVVWDFVEFNRDLVLNGSDVAKTIVIKLPQSKWGYGCVDDIATIPLDKRLVLFLRGPEDGYYVPFGGWAAAKVLTSDLEEKDTLTRIEHVLER